MPTWPKGGGGLGVCPNPLSAVIDAAEEGVDLYDARSPRVKGVKQQVQLPWLIADVAVLEGLAELTLGDAAITVNVLHDEELPVYVVLARDEQACDLGVDSADVGRSTGPGLLVPVHDPGKLHDGDPPLVVVVQGAKHRVHVHLRCLHASLHQSIGKLMAVELAIDTHIRRQVRLDQACDSSSRVALLVIERKLVGKDVAGIHHGGLTGIHRLAEGDGRRRGG
mmetsp:Transcript_153641/g.268677  ORF Transcript_153641/g.268677 Transcript_153641/m.268677 type:complete len:223 (-) Transcript_153641:747-1415(-)